MYWLLTDKILDESVPLCRFDDVIVTHTVSCMRSAPASLVLETYCCEALGKKYEGGRDSWKTHVKFLQAFHMRTLRQGGGLSRRLERNG